MEHDRGRVLAHPFVRRAARWGIVAWSFIGLSVLAYVVFRFVLYPIRIVFPPLVVALVLVYLLNPIVSALQARGLGRVWGALLTYAVFLTIVGVSMRFLIPLIAAQVTSFAKTVPDLLAKVQDSLADLARRFRLDVNTTSIVQTIGPQGGGGEFIRRIFSFTAGVFHVALIFILGPVLAFYLLVDLPKMQRAIQAMIPATRRPEVESILKKLGRALGGFFRGQLLVALFVGLASMLGLYIVGLPYWALVGMVAGLFNLIPLVGPFIGAIPALFIAFTTQTSEGLLHLAPGWPLAIGASVALLVVQQIDNHIISPNVVARTVRLHPVTVMLGLLIGGTLLGLWGMLLAVPTVAAAKILMLHYWDTRLQWPPPPSRAAEQDRGPPAEVPGEPAPEETAAAAPADRGRRGPSGNGPPPRRWWQLWRPAPTRQRTPPPEPAPTAQTRSQG